MSTKRVFITKKDDYDVISKKLMEDLNENYHLNLKKIKFYLVYDLFNEKEETIDLITKKILWDVVTDELLENVDLNGKQYIAHELLKGQFDIRAYNTKQCASLITNLDKDFTIECGELIVFEDEINLDELNKIKKYLINPAERREKDMDILKLEPSSPKKELIDVLDFKNYSKEEILNVKKILGINLDLETLLYIQKYYKDRNYDCYETELYLFDTYWSDHCRHTTFSTVLKNINFDDSRTSQYIKNSYAKLNRCREEINHNKPLTLMDLATFNQRYLKNKGLLTKVEVSEEINACSTFIKVNNDDYLLMFKNETHNHPTEIEPFGGASTCLGGAIRDPLSGRSYVYQGIRITGAADPTEDIKNTLDKKLPQLKICRESANGFSSYGNQIGMATTFVKEIYHPSYIAKRLELGAVVGYAKVENVVRKSPKDTDLIILLGGKTGKDGIGGASGSSLSHDENSLDTSMDQIQKGNPLEERKLQRLFKNDAFSKCVKKCNDFGAGGVSVAIGELADGIHIDLEKIDLKTDNLNVSQIAISESQERMAVVIDKNDMKKVLKLCTEEGVSARVVGKVTNTNKMVMTYNNKLVASIDRDLLDTNGLTYCQNINVKENKYIDYDRQHYKKLNSYSQKGLIEIFDSSVGCSTILSPLGGKNQITTQLGSVQLIPIENKTNVASVVTYGFEPLLSEISPYFTGIYAVIEAVCKQIALGATLDEMYISMQEYFPALGKDDEKWGLVFSGLLGAFEAMEQLSIAAVGGKDSMSGSFNDIDVISTIVAFAFSTVSTDRVISREFKEENSNLYFIPLEVDENNYPNFLCLKNNIKEIKKLKNILAISTVSDGIEETLREMSFGNDIGFTIGNTFDINKKFYGSFILETNEDLNINGFYKIGTTTPINEEILNKKKEHLNGLFKVYPFSNSHVDTMPYKKESNNKKYYPTVISKPKALILCFSGTNSEIDMERAFRLAGAETEIFIINSMTNQLLENSIDNLVKKLKTSHILVLPGGFSFSDEPDGSGKFIANFLKNDKVKSAVHSFLDEDKLILGICNGFQGLIKSGLLPYGKICEIDETSPTLYYNDNKKHISKMVATSVVSNSSPWLQDVNTNETHILPISHGEGKFSCNDAMLNYLQENDLIATRYASKYITTENPNGSTFEIEGIVSKCGKILGKMAHNERSRNDLYINIIGNKEQDIFKSAINYFTGGKN
ncbi:MAG: phosphoribosylformylglycinamidine synthase [Lachnospirales bacterium]